MEPSPHWQRRWSGHVFSGHRHLPEPQKIPVPCFRDGLPWMHAPSPILSIWWRPLPASLPRNRCAPKMRLSNQNEIGTNKEKLFPNKEKLFPNKSLAFLIFARTALWKDPLELGIPRCTKRYPLLPDKGELKPRKCYHPFTKGLWIAKCPFKILLAVFGKLGRN